MRCIPPGTEYMPETTLPPLRPDVLLDTLSHGQRLLTVSDYIASPAFNQMLQTRQAADEAVMHWPAQTKRDIWTKIVVSEERPAESGVFEKSHPQEVAGIIES